LHITPAHSSISFSSRYPKISHSKDKFEFWSFRRTNGCFWDKPTRSG
jgi:hypothetical protein